VITYDTEKTPMFPCEWYGGPYWNGQRMCNDTSYYFRTEDEAIANAIKLMEQDHARDKTSAI
jgi:hypothetical protein